MRKATDYQRQAVTHASLNYALLCSVHLIRKSKSKMTKIIMDIDAKNKAQADRLRDVAAKQERFLNSHYESLAQLTTENHKQSTIDSIRELEIESKQVEEEFDKIYNQAVSSSIDLSYISGMVDLYLYLAATFLKVIFIFFHTILASSSLRISTIDICIDLVLALVFHYSIYLIIPSSAIKSIASISTFMIFTVGRLLLSSTYKDDGQEFTVQRIASAIKLIVAGGEESQRAFGTGRFSHLEESWKRSSS